MTQPFHSGKFPALSTHAEYHIFFPCITLQAIEYNPPIHLKGKNLTCILPYFLKGNKFHAKIVFENTIKIANDPTNHIDILQPSEQWTLSSSNHQYMKIKQL